LQYTSTDVRNGDGPPGKIHEYMDMNIHTYIYTYIYTHGDGPPRTMYQHLDMNMYTYICIYNIYTHIYTLYIYTCIHICTYIHLCIRIHIYAHAHAHTHTNTHTHTQIYNARNRPAKKRLRRDSSYAPESHQISPNTAPEFDFEKKSQHSHQWGAAHIRKSHVPHQNGTCTRTHNHSAKSTVPVCSLEFLHLIIYT